MRSNRALGLLWTAVFAVAVIVPVAGQERQPSENVQNQAGRQIQQRPELLRQLGLTPEQVQRIRRLNMQRKPQMDAAQNILRDATKSLDEAIYADEINEQGVLARINEVQSAQAEVQRLRYLNEFAVRKILTPEQLLRFREIRRNFAEARERNGIIRQNGKGIDGTTRQPQKDNRQNTVVVTKKPIRL
jgi:Spy/CpxP family protein refolding chaperone